jgi:hypothetical protein
MAPKWGLYFFCILKSSGDATSSIHPAEYSVQEVSHYLCVLFCRGVWHNSKHHRTAFCAIPFMSIALFAAFCFHQHVFTVFDLAFSFAFNTVSFHCRLLFLKSQFYFFQKLYINRITTFFFNSTILNRLKTKTLLCRSF